MDVNGANTGTNMSEAELSSREQQLSDNLMSPFCPGRTLVACPSDEATKLRQEIRTMMQSGKSSDEIQTTLVARYGDGIRGMPLMEGFGSFAWLMPVAFLIVAAIIVTAILRRSVRSSHAFSKQPQTPEASS